MELLTDKEIKNEIINGVDNVINIVEDMYNIVRRYNDTGKRIYDDYVKRIITNNVCAIRLPSIYDSVELVGKNGGCMMELTIITRYSDTTSEASYKKSIFFDIIQNNCEEATKSDI